MRRERFRHGLRKGVAIDRKRTARWNLIGVAGTHHERAQPAHFLMQEANGVVLAIVGTQ